MIKKILTILLLGIFLISFGAAEGAAEDCLGVFKQDTSIQLTQKCPSCSYVNITSITYPNGTIFLNEVMEKTGINFNFTLPDSSQEGKISYGVIGDKNGADPPKYEDLCIQITKSGSFIETGESIMYIIILIFIMIFLGMGLYVAIITPYQNLGEMTDDGPIITKVTKTKYVKIFAIWFSYGLLLTFITILTGMINNYIQFEGMKNLFTNTYIFLTVLGYGVSVTAIVLIIWNVWKDIILNKKILEGGKALLKEL